MIQRIEKIIKNSIDVKNLIYSDQELIKKIELIVTNIIYCYKNGGKVLFCGNGGSAADASGFGFEEEDGYEGIPAGGTFAEVVEDDEAPASNGAC